MLTNEDKNKILESFLDTIKGISDKEYQKKVWIRGEGSEVDDFDETVCHFFDDGDPILECYADYGITDNQYEVLLKFRDAFENFSDENYWPLDFIDTLEWSKIREMATEVLETFDYKGKNE